MQRERRAIRSAWVGEDDGTLLVGDTVFEEEDGPLLEPSGLLGPDGQPILRYVPRKDPIGFLWHDEEGSLRPRHYFTAE